MKKYVLFIALIIFYTIVSCTPVDNYVVLTGYAQGGTWTVKLNMKGANVSRSEIKENIDRLLLEIDNSLSGYNKNSILSRFNSGESVEVDTFFVDIYQKSWDIYDVTQGCVDPASAPLFDMWGFGFKSGEMPSEEQIRETLLTSGMQRLKRNMRTILSEGGGLIPSELFQDAGVSRTPQLNYNAVAQGYSCDVIASYLYSVGVSDMMVDIGEIYCDGLNPSGNPWTIGIDRPVDGNDTPGAELQAVFSVPQGPHGVVTSGNYRKFYVRDGKRYAHTIDPRIGYPVSHTLLSATIVAPDAMTADAYATYCMVVGLEEAKKFISSSEQLEGCLIYDDRGEFRLWTSPGFILRD